MKAHRVFCTIILSLTVGLLFGCAQKEKNSEVPAKEPIVQKEEPRIEKVGVLITLPAKEAEFPTKEMRSGLESISGKILPYTLSKVLSATITFPNGHELLLPGESKQVVVPEGTTLNAEITISDTEIKVGSEKLKRSLRKMHLSFVALRGSNTWELLVRL